MMVSAIGITSFPANYRKEGPPPPPQAVPPEYSSSPKISTFKPKTLPITLVTASLPRASARVIATGGYLDTGDPLKS